MPDNTIIIVVVVTVCCCIFSIIGGAIYLLSSTVSGTSTIPSTVSGTSTIPSNVPNKKCVKKWMYLNLDENIGTITELANTMKETMKEIDECTSRNSKRDWCMLPAYKADDTNKEKQHWIYTDDENHPACLKDWTYYDKDENIIKSNIPSITKLNSDKNWCPIKKFKRDSSENKFWKYCD